MGKTFPKNCTKECPYYHGWDLSVDDYTNVCDKLHVQVDDCDAYGPFYVPILCPLDEKEDRSEEEIMSEQIEFSVTFEHFAKWVASEIFDEDWEYNKDAFAELACRKLAKLGIVKANGDEWELVEPHESEGE